jgi:cyclic beta-1,2-glucan synthetase
MAYDYVAVASRRGHYVTPAAQWLPDNFHLIAQLQQIEGGVSQRYYADLPKLAERPLKDCRGSMASRAYIAHTDSVLDAELSSFLHAYQRSANYTGELWALPTTPPQENLRRMADRIAWNKVAREPHAVYSADQTTTQDLDELLATLRQRLERSFLTQL